MRRLVLFSLLAAAAWASMVTSVRADPSPVSCDTAYCPPPVFCFRVTDLRNPGGLADKIELEFEILNWTGTEVHGLAMAVNVGTGYYSAICGPIVIPSVSAFLDADGRPLGAGDDDDNFPPADGQSGTKSGAANPWQLTSSSGTSFQFTEPTGISGNGLPARDLLGAGSSAAACALVPGCSMQFGFPRVTDRETVDNGGPGVDGGVDNVLDGFTIRIDDFERGDLVSLNWFLLDAAGEPIGVSGSGNGFGFGTFNIWGAGGDSTSCLPAKVRAVNNPAVWARIPGAPEGPGQNQGTSSDVADMFVSTTSLSSVEIELGGAMTAPFLDHNDNVFSAPINAEQILFPTAAPIAGRFQLAQNSPNPFNPRTNISFSAPVRGHVTLKLFSLRGLLVRTLLDETMDAGDYTIPFDGRDDHGISLASGVYLYEMAVGDQREVKKLALLK